ncbi:MAG: M61 family metallopeptidase [Nevskia sp.]
MNITTARIPAALLGFAAFSFPVHASARAAEAANLVDQPYPGTLNLSVDLRDSTRKIFRVRESIPVKGGALTLYYPKWIPGEHSPSGTINGVTGLKISTGGRLIEWRRDLEDPFTLRVDVPTGTSTIEVDFQYLSPTDGGEFGGSVSATPRLVDLEWNQVLFYPAGYPARQITVQAGVRLPEGWSYGTALEAQVVAAGENMRFKPVSLETLIDSPLIAGLHFKRFELARVGSRPVVLDVVADRPENLAASDEQIRQQRAIVEQAAVLFGEHHYERYHFLLTLSDRTGHFGLEHHQSSDDRLDADFFTDKMLYLSGSSLLPHEYTHSWNGKFRRPEGLATPHYNLPMKDELLWVYEGLTQHVGEMLTARAGLYTPEQYRDAVAGIAAQMTHRPGRNWRPLQDTADAAQLLYFAPKAWSNWRRAVDFYPEGLLLWLSVDTRIRDLSGGRRSLDDFIKAFYGLADDKRLVVPYDFEDIVGALNRVQPYEWSKFLREKLDATDPEAPLDGITQGGWKLGYSETASDYFKASEKARKRLDRMDSIGVLIGNDDDDKGKLLDVLWQGPAFLAGLAPGMKIVAVDGEAYSDKRLDDAIKAAATDRSPIELLIRNADYYTTLKLDYREGPKFPKLLRAGGPDRLALIGRARK